MYTTLLYIRKQVYSFADNCYTREVCMKSDVQLQTWVFSKSLNSIDAAAEILLTTKLTSS